MSELAELLGRAAPEYLRRHAARMPPGQQRALLSIQRCRTPALGGQLYRCASCGTVDFAYHSCHHRACPRCGGAKTAAWTQRQTERLLPVPYFLVTFTVPAALRFAFLARPELLHDLLFQQSAAALQQIAAEPRHLGAELGFLGVLHTWTRQLVHHPHVHYIVAGGGLRADRKKWRKTRRPDWLLPAPVLAARFRQGMEQALAAAAPELHAQVPDSCWRRHWVVDVQPAGSGRAVVRYLARYVGRTALSDERLLRGHERSVSFRYTDSKTGRKRICTLATDEFLRRYLQHVLPPGQHRVRYFGWMHPAAKRRRLIVETLLAVALVLRPEVPADSLAPLLPPLPGLRPDPDRHVAPRPAVNPRSPTASAPPPPAAASDRFARTGPKAVSSLPRPPGATWLPLPRLTRDGPRLPSSAAAVDHRPIQSA